MNLNMTKANLFDKGLLMLWVFSYAVILQVFRVLKKFD